MNYVIGALQYKLPRAPLPFNPALIVGTEWCYIFQPKDIFFKRRTDKAHYLLSHMA